MTLLAFPLVAVLTLGASPPEVAAVAALRWIPFLLFSLVVGAWIDRIPRRPVMIISDIARALLFASIPLAAAAGALTMLHLYVIAFLVGCFDVSFSSAVFAFLPSLVARDRLLEYNQRLGVSDSVARVAGPGLGGVLVDTIGAPFALVASTVSAAASALFVMSIPDAERVAPRTHRSLWRDLTAGWLFVRDHRVQFALLGAAGTANFCSSLAFASGIFLLYLTRQLAITPGVLGGIFAGGGMGFIAGSLMSPAIGHRIGVGRALIALLPMWGLSYLLIALATDTSLPSLALITAGYVLGGFAFAAYSVITVTVQQVVTPSDYLGRVTGFGRTVTWGVLPLGSVVGGILAEAVGLRGVVVVAALGIALSTSWLVRSPLSSWSSPGVPNDALVASDG